MWSLRIWSEEQLNVGLLSVRLIVLDVCNRGQIQELWSPCSVPLARPCRVFRTFCMFQRHMLITMWAVVTMGTAWKATWWRPSHKWRYLSAKREHVHAYRLYAFWHTAWRKLNHLQPTGHYMNRTEVTIWTAHWPLYVSPGLTVTSLRSANTAVFIYFVWIWEQTAIISLYSINWLVCITDTECVYCAVRTGYLYIIQVTISL